jgi:hypothetical protein
MLGNSFNVFSLVKPNSDLEKITVTAQSDINKLTKNDVVVVCGGSLNIARNDAKNGLRCLTHFVESNNNTNLIILEAPHRFDLATFSCVNKEVKLFNKRLQRSMMTFKHVKVLSMNTNREHHTKHGLHLNGLGKDWICSNLVTQIKKLFLPNKILPPIILSWKDVSISKQTQHYQSNDYTANEHQDDIMSKLPHSTEESHLKNCTEVNPHQGSKYSDSQECCFPYVNSVIDGISLSNVHEGCIEKSFVEKCDFHEDNMLHIAEDSHLINCIEESPYQSSKCSDSQECCFPYVNSVIDGISLSNVHEGCLEKSFVKKCDLHELNMLQAENEMIMDNLISLKDSKNKRLRIL